MVIVVLLAPFIPLIISGRWDWWQAWAYAVVSILAFIISRLFVRRKHPDLITERARFMDAKDTKSWDKVLAPLVGLGSIFILVAAGLDKYYALSPVSNLTLTPLASLLEDKTLQAELPGYKEFAGKTKYRLFPWIW